MLFLLLLLGGIVVIVSFVFDCDRIRYNCGFILDEVVVFSGPFPISFGSGFHGVGRHHGDCTVPGIIGCTVGQSDCPNYFDLI